MTQRYALYPGPVTSRADGQVHHVSAAELYALYRVNPRDCLVVTQADLCRPDRRDLCARAAVLVALRPRRDGNYSLPVPAPLERPSLRMAESPLPDGGLRRSAEKELLVASCVGCPVCGQSQRGGLPVSCPVTLPQGVCPIGGGVS
jgi:hypothetical protein